MPNNLTIQSRDATASWLSAPEVRETLARVERGESTPADLQRLIDAAPPERRALMPLAVRAVRAIRIMEEARERAVDQAQALMRRALSTGDPRTAVEACRAIARANLLDEPEEPRLVGADVDEPGFAIEIKLGEAIVEQDVVKLPSCDRALVALVAQRSAVPAPVVDDEQLAHLLARAMVAEVSR